MVKLTPLPLTFIILTFNLLCGTYAQAQHNIFEKSQLLEDIEFLEVQLQKYHPNLYVYHTKEEIDRAFENLKTELPNSMHTTEAFSHISQSASIVKDGHFIFQPDKETLQHYYASAKLLPLDLYWLDDKAYLLRNYTDMLIDTGVQVVSINGIKSSEIRQTIVDRVIRDGNNKTYPQWILNKFLRPYFCFFYESPDTFTIDFIDAKDKPQTIKLNGLRHAEIRAKSIEKYPDYTRLNNPSKGIELILNKEKSLARLNIKSFDDKILKQSYKQRFKKSIKEVLAQLESNQINNLIIDLRGNQGGEVTNGIFLLRHLLDEPFQVVLAFNKVDKKNFTDPIKRIKSDKGFGTGFYEPKSKNHFSGKLILLVNGGSYSNSGIFSHIIQSNKRGLIIGQETGGSAYTLVGYPEKKMVLPNTKIQVSIPRLQFILQPYKNQKKTGVIPDVTIVPSISNMINSQDPAYEAAYNMMN